MLLAKASVLYNPNVAILAATNALRCKSCRCMLVFAVFRDHQQLLRCVIKDTLGWRRHTPDEDSTAVLT